MFLLRLCFGTLDTELKLYTHLFATVGLYLRETDSYEVVFVILFWTFDLDFVAIGVVLSLVVYAY